MATIDERIVSMAFENAKFEAGIATTLASLKKLDDTLKNVGANQALSDIEKSASKVTLNAPMSAIDKLRAKFSQGTQTNAISDIEKAGNQVTLQEPIKAIDKLQSKLGLINSGSTFNDIEKAADQVQLNGISKAVEAASHQFTLLQGAAAVAFGNIASQAAMKGLNFAKGFGVGPIIDGLHEYETNLKSIQTIQANTDRPLTEINKSLQELNTYSDQTIYNFSEMARNIGTFTAAGVDLKTATSSIKGIANLAALSGSNSQQAATAMYQLSQAISSGRVGLQDWNSVVNAGMGGKKLQNALAQTSIAMGDMKDSSVKLEGPMKKLTINGQSFRESIQAKPGQKPWLTSEVLVNTLATLDGRFSKAALSAELTKDGLKKYTAAQVEARIEDNRAALEKKNGVKYTDAQFDSLMKLSDSAFKSATEVKTLGQVFDVAKETIGSGWSASFQSIFGNLTEAKTLFTGMSTAINGFINKTSLARNELLAGWKAMGGRTLAIQALKNIFKALFDLLGKIGHAFREVFPKKTSEDLYQMTRSFLVFTSKLNNFPDVVDNIVRTFKGFFAVLHIGWEIIKGVVGVFGDLLGVVGKGSGGFLNFTGSVGDFLVAVDNALTKGGLLKGFFEALSNILKSPLKIITAITTGIFGMFGGADPSKAKGMGDAMELVGEKIKPLASVLDKYSDAWDRLKKVISDVGEIVTPWITRIGDAFQQLGAIIADGIKNADFDLILHALNTTFLGGLFIAIKKALGGGLTDQLGGGLLKDLSGIFKGLTGNLEAMQQNIKANTLLTIAGAIAVLAAGILVLSQIDPKKLSNAMAAVAIGLGEFAGAMAIMSKISIGGLSMTGIAVGMLIMAGAMLVLAGAVKIFSTMDWEELAKGLAGVAGGMTAIGIGMKFLGPGTLVQGPALILIGIALNILAAAVKQFADMKWEDLAKGLIGAGVALGLVAAAALLMPPNMIASGAGLILMATGMTFMVAAIAAMGALDPKVIAKGIIGIALAVTALSVAIIAMPPTVALQAAGLILLSGALTGIAAAIGIMGKMSLGTIVKGLFTMGAALAELSVGMWLMIGTAPGAVALLGAAAAFAILAPAMAIMGNLDWGTILKALVTMAATMLTLAVVGTLAAVPLAALGAALIILGTGLLIAVVPVYLLAKALSLLGSEGTKGIGVMVAALTAFVALLPKIIIDFVKGLVDIIAAVAQIAPKVVIALGIIIDSILLTVIQAIPKLKVVITKLLGAFVEIINAQAVPVIAAGIALLLALLDGISQNIGKITDKAAEVVREFMGGLTRNASSIIASGFKLILTFLDGISKGIPRIVAKVGEMVTKFLGAVTAQLPRIIPKGAEMIIAFLNGVASKIGGIVQAGASLIGKFIVGIGDAIPGLVKQGLHTARKFLNGLADGLSGLADIGFKAVIRFLNGIEKSIRENSNDLFNAGAGIADAIFDAIIEQAGKAGPALKKVFDKVFGLLPGWVKRILGIKSPSTVFADIGRMTMKGFQEGVDGERGPAAKQMIMLGHGIIEAFKGVLQIRSPSQVMREIGKQVGAGFKQGLEGSADDIRSSFRGLNDKLREEMRNARKGISDEHKKLEDLEKQHADKLKEIRDLKSKKKPDEDAIKTATQDLKDIERQMGASQRAINKYQYILDQAGAAHSKLVGDLQASKQWLVVLSKELDKVNEQLDKANQDLERLTNERADYAKSIKEQFSKLPEIDKEAKDPVADYKQKLKDQIVATQKFYDTMRALREAGLDDVTFKRLLSEGLGAQDFASQLLRTGQAGIQQVNDLDTQLSTLAEQMGTNVAGSLYDAGVEAAQGLVDGLKARAKELETVMGTIADNIVAAIKKALGIKSPSRIFAEVGKFAAEGLAQGFKDNSAASAAAASQMGKDAVSAMQQTVAAMSGAVTDNIDIQPTITPVLDLTQVEKDAGALSDLTNVVPITAAASFGQASAISSEQAAALADAAVAAQPTNHVELTQNNYSPDPLSNIEIYRQTNNQMSLLKKALNV